MKKYFLLITLGCLFTSIKAAFADSPVLSSKVLSVTFDVKSGAVSDITDLDKSQKIITNATGVYEIIQRQDRKYFSESTDQVTQTQQHADSISFTAVNPNLPGVTLTKNYWLDADGARLHKKITVNFAQTQDEFLGLLTQTQLAPDFRKGGFLSDPRRHPQDDPRISADSIKSDASYKMFGQADWHQVIFTNANHDESLLHMRTKIDDQFVLPITGYSYEQQFKYTSGGWQFGLEAFKFQQGQTHSAEWILQLVHGDQMDAWQAEKSLADYQKETDQTTPSWLSKVKYLYGWNFSGDDDQFPQIRHIAEQNKDGYILVMLSGLFGSTGDYPIESDWFGAHHAAASAAKIRALVDRLHAISPRVKVTAYSWWWGVDLKSTFAKEHPDWLVHDAAGKPDYVAIGPNYDRVYGILLNDQTQQYILDRYDKMVRAFNLDTIYIDGGQGGITLIDWNMQHKASDADWGNFSRGIRDTGRKVNPDIAFFTNGTPGLYTLYSDCGYFEGFHETKDWRALSERLVQVKFFQNGDAWTAPLYWVSNNEKDYINYIYLLGLKPADVQYSAQMLDSRSSLFDLAYQLRGMRLMNIPYAPRWWRGNGNAEVYLFQLNQDRLITALGHNGVKSTFVDVSRKAFKLPENKPIFVWQWTLQNQKTIDSNRHGGQLYAQQLYTKFQLSPEQAVNVKAVKVLSSTDNDFHFPIDLSNGRTNGIYLSACPAVVFSVDHQMQQIWQSQTDHLKLSGALQTNSIGIQTQGGLPGEIVVLSPWKNNSFSLDGKSTSASILPGIAPENWTAFLVAIPAGNHQLKIQQQAETSPLKNGDLQIAAQAKQLNITGKDWPANAMINLSLFRSQTFVAHQQIKTDNNGNLNWQIPTGVLEPGDYQAMLQIPANQIVTSNSISITSDLPQLTAGLVEHRNNNQQVVSGLSVLASYEQTSGHNEDNYAHVDRDKLLMEAGLKKDMSGFGYAGMQLNGAKNLLLKISSAPPSEGRTYSTYYNAFQGITVDFHTAQGWARRLWIPTGSIAGRLAATDRPYWGTQIDGQRAPQVDALYADLTKTYAPGHSGLVWLDLQSYAPENWDGEFILGACDLLTGADTSVQCQIEKANAAAPPDALKLTLQSPAIPALTGFNVQPSRVTLHGVHIDAGILPDGKIIDAGNAETSTGKITVTGDHQAGGLLISEARVLTLEFTRTNSAKGAFLAVDYHTPGGFTQRVALPVDQVNALKLPLLQNGENTQQLADKSFSWNGSSKFTSQLDLFKNAPEDWDGQVILWLESGATTSETAKAAVRIIDNSNIYIY